MKNLKYLILIFVLVIFTTGCVNKNKENKAITNPNTQNVVQEKEKFTGDIYDLFKKGKGLKCSLTLQDQLFMTTYIDGKNELAKTEINMKDGRYVYSLKADANNIYVWNNFQKGSKISLGDTQDPLKSRIEYNECADWNIDKDFFKIPDTIKFDDKLEDIVNMSQ